MSELTPRESELVALGAALGSNCIPCVEYHVAESRKVGLTDAEIRAAIERADKIRQVPARKSLQAGLGALGMGPRGTQEPGTAEPCGCGAAESARTTESTPAHSAGSMMAMMSKMMAACGDQSHAAGAAVSGENKPTANAHPSQGCGCA